MDSKPWKNSKRARVKAEPEGDVEYESEEGKMEVDDAGGENEVEEDEEEDENEEDEEDDEDDNEDENLDSEDDNRDDYDNDDNSDAAETVHDSETRSEASTRSVTRVSSPEQAQAQAQPAQSRPFKTSFWRVAEPSQQPSPAASERDELESSPPRDDLDSDSDDIKPVVSSLVQPEDVEMDSESDNDDVVNTQHTAGHLDWIVDATPLARSRSPSVRSDSFDD
jgi:hypothetical protein